MPFQFQLISQADNMACDISAGGGGGMTGVVLVVVTEILN